MRLAFPASVFLFICMGGCASIHSGHDDAPTIASLKRIPVTLEDIPVDADESRAIDAYQAFLKNSRESEQRPQAMRRLADLGLESGELLPDSPAISRASTPQAAAVDNSIQLYRDVLEQYPERADNDSILYQLGRAYEQNGRADASLGTLRQLIEQYPHSRYILEAHFRSAEIRFVEKDYPEAGLAYKNVVAAAATSPFYRQSLYKLGWCYFKQGLYPEGLDSFMALLDRVFEGAASGEQQLKQLGRADYELVDDTLRVISLSFSYESGAQAVADYFSRHGPRRYEDIIYERLGSLYLARERYTDAAHTFRTFAEKNPDHEQAPRFQMRVIETFEKGKFPTLVLEGKQQFVERYNLKGDYWKSHAISENSEIIAYLRTSMTELSRHYHALAQRTRKQADYRQAIHWYRSYLDSFPDSDEAPMVNFLLAETLFESADYQLATREYENTAYHYGDHEKAADAGYASVLACVKAEKALQAEAKQSWHQASIENALRFSSRFPQHPQALAVRTRASENLLATGDNARAARTAREINSSQAATAEQRRVAWAVQAHASFDLQQYPQAELAYQQLSGLLPAGSKEKNNIIERLAASIYKQGEAAQKAGDTQAAVVHFQRVSRLAPGAGIAATADYDAAAALMSLQDWSAAARQLQQFRRSYPDDPRQMEVTRRLANALLAGKKPEQAAAEFERIGQLGSDPKLRREALRQSAELYAKAGQPERAINAYRSYAKQFPQPAEAAVEAGQRIAELHKAGGRTRDYEKWLSYVIATDKKAGNESTDRTRYLAAQATFALSDSSYGKYLETRLTLPLDKSLALKKRLMEKCLAMYEQAATYQVAAITTAATYRSADIYLQMGKSLMTSERPVDLSGEPLEQYNILLEDQAYPFEEQAIALHETNIERIRTGTFNSWVEKSLQQLSVLVPARYAKLERSAPYVESLY